MDTQSSLNLNAQVQPTSSFQAASYDSNIESVYDSECLAQIYQVYLYQGPSWKLISEKAAKSFFSLFRLKNPKNILNNGIRKVARTLSDLQIQLSGSKRRLITKQLILSTLEIINRTQKHIQILKLTLNTESKLFKFKESIVKLALWENALTYDEKIELIKLLKQINIRLRSLGVFKVKHRKNWKMSDKALRLISSFDQITVEQKTGSTQKDQQQLQNEQKSVFGEISHSSIISLDWHFRGEEKLDEDLLEVEWEAQQKAQFFQQWSCSIYGLLN